MCHFCQIGGAMMKQDDNIRPNDLFFLCSLIEYVARKTHNRRAVVVNAIGRQGLKRIYDLADVFHCENIDKITYELIDKYQIVEGNYDTVSLAKYSVPTHWDLGKVYERLIAALVQEKGSDVVETLIEVYNSWIVDRIDNYNSSMYYENNSYLMASYQAGHAI